MGQSQGLTPYQRNIVYTSDTNEPDPDPNAQGRSLVRPYLADESNGWGPHVALRMLVDSFSVSLAAQWHAREQLTVHHEGSSLISQRRQRPDGSYDDAGVDYTPLDEEELIPARQRNRGDLFVSSLQGGWRWQFIQDWEGFSVFVPMEAGLVLVYISEPARPIVFGLRAEAGLGVSYKLTDTFSLRTSATLSALGTLEYNPLEDATRRAEITGSSTASSLFSSMIQSTLDFGLIFRVR